MTATDEIEIIKWTVILEAAGEPFLGKLAVANVIVNRMQRRKKNAFEICWAPYQFSAWLDPLTTIAKKLSRETDDTAYECGKAAVQAYNRQTPDPSRGADHYLNRALTIRNAGKLPSWVDQFIWTVDIGAHSFYKS